MPTHAEKRRLPQTPDQLFELVADVEQYGQFLPWCIACRITKQVGDTIYADMVVGFKMIREKYTSEVTLCPDKKRIDVEYVNGPFKYLKNHWQFEKNADGSCTIDFYIDFEFKSKLLQGIMQPLFNEAVQRMVSSFEERALELYGSMDEV